jgi:hypothetical protein
VAGAVLAPGTVMSAPPHAASSQTSDAAPTRERVALCFVTSDFARRFPMQDLFSPPDSDSGQCFFDSAAEPRLL